jgi:lysophospholipase L1-like esterase
MVERYDRALMDLPQPAWDFSRWTPDLVVVCLGINDYAGLRHPDGTVSADNSAAFRDAYGKLLDKVRGHYPGAEVLALAPHVPWAREQVNQVVRERRDPFVHYGQFDEFPAECYVADGHPTVATHRKIADQVMQRLAELKLAGS